MPVTQSKFWLKSEYRYVADSKDLSCGPEAALKGRSKTARRKASSSGLRDHKPEEDRPEREADPVGEAGKRLG